MILTGPEIRARVERGIAAVKVGVRKSAFVDDLVTTMDEIHIEPYDPKLVGPNSVDLRLGDKLLVYENGLERIEGQKPGLRQYAYTKPAQPLDMRKENPTSDLEIPEEGLVLQPGVLYLGTTIECIGSNAFVPIVEGRSSIGRLGLHVHVTAGFCDLGFRGQITLEIHVIHPIRVYAGTPICQAYFLTPQGEIELYKGRYQDQTKGPVASRIQLSKEEFGGETSS